MGRDTDELVGRFKMQDLLTMGGRIFHQTHWAPLLQMQGSVAEVKLQVLHRDGTEIPMVMNAVRRAHGDVVLHELAVFVAEDRHKYERELMSARNRAQQLLANEQAAKVALADAQAQRDAQQAVAEERALFAEQMMGIVSHDLRNPLSVIRMSAHLIERGELSSKQLQALGRLNNSVSRANRLIADLLDFTQAKLGRGLEIGIERVDLHALMADCVEDLRLAFSERTLIHRQHGSGNCAASGDRLIQLVGNLVGNAIAYGAPGRPVTVTSRIEASVFSIAVHNEGAPIPPELLPVLFDPMTRGAPDHGRADSVGLGLFIVREIVRAHGGTMNVVSLEGQGTTFTATFPRSEE